MLTRAELHNRKDWCLDRACGALVGHAIGDSFGDAARTQESHFLFGITMDFREGPAPGTDDTEFALLTAQTLLECQGDLTDEAVLDAWRRFVVPLTELPRGGASEREAAANIRRGVLPPRSGQFNAYHLSDGAAMRMTPIGIVCAGDPVRAAHLAETDARISHWRDGLWGAQSVAAGVAVAMAGGTVDEVFDAGVEAAPEDSWLRFTLSRAREIIAAERTLESAWMPLHQTLWSEYKAVVPEAVAEAFSVLKLVDGDFRRGIIYAGNWGRDADTIAALVGAFAGAMHGCSVIPPAWTAKVRTTHGACLPFTKDMDLMNVAGRLADLI